MVKTINKLYKNPKAALKAAEALKAKGFSDSEVGLLMRGNGQLAVKGATKLALPRIGDGVASGHLAAALSQGAAKEEDLDKALAGALGISADVVDYYKFGVTVGSVLVSVQADEKKLADAKQVLHQAEAAPHHAKTATTSPGFAHASRMAATNPVDAPMTGDFRRY